MIKTIFNSFGRTLGRILCYILIGIVIAILTGLVKVNADTRSNNWVSNIKYLPSNSSVVNWSSSTDFSYFTPSSIRASSLFSYETFGDSAREVYNDNDVIYYMDDVVLGSNGRSFGFTTPYRLFKDQYHAITTYICYSGGDMPQVTRIGAGDSYNTAFSGNVKYKSTTRMYLNWIDLDPDNATTLGYTRLYCGSYFSIIQPIENSFTFNLRMDGVSTKNSYFLMGIDAVPLADANQVTTAQIENIVKNSGLATATSVEEVNTAVQKVQEESEKINNSITSDDEDDTSKSCGIICKLKSIVSFLKPDHLINIIVPTEKQMNDLLDDTTDMIATKIGILGLPMTVYTQFIKLINNTSETDYCMNWDAVHVPNFEEAVPIISAGNFCFSSILENEKIATFRSTCMTIIGGLILFAFVAYLKNSYNKIFDIPDREEYTYFTTEDTYTVDDHTGEVLNHKYSQRKTFREKR